jgi:hypothetical protein
MANGQDNQPIAPDIQPASPQMQPTASLSTGIPNQQPQPPQAGPPVPPAQPQQSQAMAKPHESRTGAMFHAVLSTLGGPKTSYQVDPRTGAMIESTEPRKAGDWARNLIAGAFTGLAAGSEAPRGSGLPGGIGAGAVASMNQTVAQDKEKRARAAEDYERQQQNILRQHEVARSNGLMFSNWLANLKLGNDLDPQRADNKAVAEELKSAGVPVTYMTKAEAEAAKAAEKSFVANHISLPVGYSPVMGDNGEPVMDENGKPISQPNFAIINSTHPGQVRVPSSFADDLHTFGPAAGLTGVEGVNANDEIPMRDFITYHHRIEDGRNKVLQGWAKPQTVWTKDEQGKDVPMMYNPLAPQGEQTKPFPEGMSPQGPQQVANVAKTEEETKKAAAQAEQARQAAAKTAEETQLLKNMGITLPPNFVTPPDASRKGEQELQQMYTSMGVQLPGNFSSIYGLAHYKVDPTTFPNNPHKGTNEIGRSSAVAMARRMVNPSYDETNYPAVKKLKEEFASTRPNTAGGNEIAFNTATAHLGRLFDAAKALENNDLVALNNLALFYKTQTGQSAPNVYAAVRAAIVGEIGKTFKGAAPDIPEIKELQSTLEKNQSPTSQQDVAKTYAHLMLSKAVALASHYYAYTGELPPGVIDAEAQKVYARLGIPVPIGEMASGISSPAQGVPAENPFAPGGKLNPIQQSNPTVQ